MTRKARIWTGATIFALLVFNYAAFAIPLAKKGASIDDAKLALSLGVRISGATLSEGSWHYQSIWNVGGGTNMYDLKTRKWGSTTSEGKDIRNVAYSNYFPATFGGNFGINAASTVEQYEHIQAISVGVGATYLMELNQKSIESCPQKEAIFKTIRIWEDARAANAFPWSVKKQLSDPTKNWKLENGADKNTWKLYRMVDDFKAESIVLKRGKGY